METRVIWEVSEAMLKVDCVVLKVPSWKQWGASALPGSWMGLEVLGNGRQLWTALLSQCHTMVPNDNWSSLKSNTSSEFASSRSFPSNFSFLPFFSFVSLISEISAFIFLKYMYFSYCFLSVQFSFLSASVLDPWSNLRDSFKCFISWVLAFYCNLFYIKKL